MNLKEIDSQQLHDALISKGDIDLIDVRTPVEFREVHVTAARNLPLDQLDPRKIAEQRKGTSAPLYVICKSGGRSRQACEKLIAAGCENVISVEGGTSAWDRAGFPVARGRKAIALERQVRIAAGTLVLTGVVLSQLLSIWWIGLSGFVGAGLVFSGVTDTCGMGLLLAKMPWNRVSGGATM